MPTRLGPVRDPTSKSGRIRALLAEGLTPQQIAPLIPCSDAYVRLVRRDGVNQRAWTKRNPEKMRALGRKAQAKRKVMLGPARYRAIARSYYDPVKRRARYERDKQRDQAEARL